MTMPHAIRGKIVAVDGENLSRSQRFGGHDKQSIGEVQR
jgi:hypothetical protein